MGSMVTRFRPGDDAADCGGRMPARRERPAPGAWSDSQEFETKPVLCVVKLQEM